MNTAVALIIFNRPDTTEQVFAEVARARPPKLLVVADGPRTERPGEAEKCAQTRAVIERVDWDCEVLTNYSEVNLGCQLRPASGLDWVFQEVEEAIILEDDCLPDPSFFRYCEELLERYRTDERVTMISGDNWQFGRKRTSYSYYFSRYTHTWGWASWRRAWRHFDLEMKLWATLRETSWLSDIFADEAQVAYFRSCFDAAHTRQLKTVWDYQWFFASLTQNGLAILPNTNLISNIGFGDDATHTKDLSAMARVPVREMVFPLEHPPFVWWQREADRFTFREIFSPAPPGLHQRIRRRLAAVMPDSVHKLISDAKS
jgi:hypothetical protein